MQAVNINAIQLNNRKYWEVSKTLYLQVWHEQGSKSTAPHFLKSALLPVFALSSG